MIAASVKLMTDSCRMDRAYGPKESAVMRSFI